MNVKKIIIGLIITGIAWSVGISHAGDRFEWRKDRQNERIYKGVKHGKINKREYNRLVNEQRRIERSEDRAWRDGRLTYGERERLDRMQNRASKNIYRSKHNHRKKQWQRNDCGRGRGRGGRHHNYKPMSYRHRPMTYYPGLSITFHAGY